MFRMIFARLSQTNIKCYSTVNAPPQASSEFEVVFSLPSIKYISLLNRLKVYQLVGTSVAIPGCYIMEGLDALPPGAFWSATCIGLTGAALFSLASLPFRNTIGFLYISKDNEKIKISSMDFWGRRRDRIISANDWIPLLDMSPKKMDPFYLTPQISDGSQYKLFIKFGHVINAKKMALVLE